MEETYHQSVNLTGFIVPGICREEEKQEQEEEEEEEEEEYKGSSCEVVLFCVITSVDMYI